jgi:hypothetical protein
MATTKFSVSFGPFTDTRVRVKTKRRTGEFARGFSLLRRSANEDTDCDREAPAGR